MSVVGKRKTDVHVVYVSFLPQGVQMARRMKRSPDKNLSRELQVTADQGRLGGLCGS